MKVVQVHNYYQQPGGEDQVFAAETALLESHGQQVLRYTVHNKAVELHGKLALGQKTIWNQSRYRELRSFFQRKKPNVVHVHNTLPLISPAIYYASHASRIPICQTLHNYRPLCPNALLFRNNKVCEDCIGRFLAWPGVKNACYRGSRPATIAVSLMNFFHRLMGTWKNKIDVYIALSEFSKKKYIQAGFLKKKIVVKHNFVESISCLSGLEKKNIRKGALFVGRLSREKGIGTLLKAIKIYGNSMPLKIIGDGPLASVVQKNVSDNFGISWLGQRPILEVYELMAKAELLVFPSEWYEGMPRTIIEAFAQGTPVISSELGAMAEMIDHGRTGLHFETGNAQDLAEKILWANKHPNELVRMGQNARTEYEAKYTPERNYTMLMEIYEQAIENHAKQQRRVNRG
jgi:glycosyltransferase involved in cell wall biosynthesis